MLLCAEVRKQFPKCGAIIRLRDYFAKMADELEIEIEGLALAIANLQDISDRVLDLRPASRAVFLAIQGEVDEVFNSAPSVEGGGQVYGGEYWEPLSEAYLAARDNYPPSYSPRIRPRRGGQILRDTGELLNSIGIGSQLGGPSGGSTGDRIAQVDGQDTFVFGTSLPKAKGLNRDRPFLYVFPEMIEVVSNALEAYIVEGLT